MQNVVVNEHDKQKCVSYLLGLGIGSYCHNGEVLAEVPTNEGENISLILKDESIIHYAALYERLADYAGRE